MANAIDPACDPFALHIAPQSCLTRAAWHAARPICEQLLGINQLRMVYDQARRSSGATFESRVLQALDVGIRVNLAEGRSLPDTGPLIVAANHPTGALDGLVVAELTRRIRSDVRIVTSHLLARIPELRECCYFVDPFGGPMAAARSRAGLRAAHLWLRSGGALVMFPAGEVAWRRSGDAIAVEAPWCDTLGRLASATRARILPVFVEGTNSWLFHGAGRVHPLLRTGLLGRELINKRGTTVRVHVGRILDAAAKPATSTTARVRQEVQRLERSSTAALRSIAPPVAADALARDIRSLTGEAHLLSTGPFDVFCADAPRLPNVLAEIGRLREITFRQVGEGTGLTKDIDRFDQHYAHLFVWHRERREIVGAYRLAFADRIVADFGIAGLYTSTLFQYDARFLQRLGPALELGRSFVRLEYQRNYQALLLLWKGIGEIVARHPAYVVLFGPVSISRQYSDGSRQVLCGFLENSHQHREMAALIRPVNPASSVVRAGRAMTPPKDLETADALIRGVEGTAGVPVLLRHYLRLNAQVLGFNVDPAFSDALDALMMVDLTTVEPTRLRRCLGASGSAAVLLGRHTVEAA